MTYDEQNFVHIHLHTEYSLLDGFARIEQAVDFAKEMDMPALAITDHGTMFGVIDFYRACKAQGIKPLIGVEAYLARRTRFDRDSQRDTKPYHMLLLAENQGGYQNLLKLSSEAMLNGYYYRPRIDRDLMAEHAEGIIATSGCLAAEIPRAVETGNDERALELIGWYQDVFGKDNFFLELQEHDIPEIHKLNKWLVDHADYANVPLVATNDVHYVRYEDYDPHDTLLCIQTSSTKDEANRLRMTDNSYHMRSQREMWNIFHEVPEALSNTVAIAERCEVDLDSKGYHLPVFPVPERFNDNSSEYLRYLCEKGMYWRYGDAVDSNPAIRERLDHELFIIDDMGFNTYFLIVWDLTQFARHVDIWWNVRGSGAGSVVAYTLGITSLDPLENGLIFERFLNPGRVSMPDFDLDFPEDRRMEMIEYCTRKYGEDKVAAIITFGTLGAKGAIRDVGRALGVPLPEVDSIARTIPTQPKLPKIPQLIGNDPDKAIPDLKKIYDSNPQAREIIDIAAKVEGVPRHASTHAAGIIVADKPLVEYLPLHRPTKGDAEDSPVKMVTQFPMETAESIGLLKVDFLGLSTLTILRKACELVERYHGIRYDMSNIPIKPDLNDAEITRRVEEMFKMIGRGETVGVFQIESSGMRQMLQEMRPQTFEHIIAAISLYRPGPMDYIPTFNRRLHGEEDVQYHHPKLEPILSNTYGILVYQEQIMQVAADLFGYALGEADLMRRAVSKKKEKDLKEHRDIFLKNGPENGVDAESAGKIFDDIEFFARYGFNKSHAADYAVITCQTAYLKCHYPHEYMSALMSVYYDVSTKVSLFIADCRRMGIKVLQPDVNYSETDFTIEESDGERHIRYGMGAIKNLGLGAIEYILEQRAGQPFENLDDFLKRCDAREIGKRGIESLIKAGAMDSFTPEGQDRAYLFANLDRIMGFSTQHHKNAAVGQMSLFDLMSDGSGESGDAGSVLTTMTAVPDPKHTKREQLTWEKDLVGLYISDHPLNEIWSDAQKFITHTTAEIHEDGNALKGKQVKVAGLVSEIRNIVTKKGDPMAVINLEDVQGTIEVVLFPRTWAEVREDVAVDRVCAIIGEADMRGSDMQIKAMTVMSSFQASEAADPLPEPASFLPPPNAPIVIDVDDEFYDEETGEIAEPMPEPPPPPREDAVVPASSGGSVPTYRLVSQHDQAPTSENGQNTAEAVAPQPTGQPSAVLFKPPTPESQAKVAAPRRTLVIEIKRSYDSQKDRRRLSKVKGLALSYPGNSQFCIIYENTQGTRTKLSFPAIHIDIHQDLINELWSFEFVADITEEDAS